MENDEPVLYITLGSEVIWQKWYVDVIWGGLKNLKCRIIWSMPTGLPLPESPRIYSASWLPQVELLSHPAVKAGMHHAGFGCTIEFINAGLPAVVFPHFGDQPINADKMINSGIGISLFWHWRTFRDGADDRNHFVPNPIFGENDVERCFKTILNEKKYKINTMKMRVALRTQGGRALAVQTVENAYLQSKSNTRTEKQTRETLKAQGVCDETM